MRLYQEVGPLWALVLGILFVVSPAFIMWRKDETLRRGYDLALQAKEDQIQRIAEDNRIWRRLFCVSQGMSPEEAIRLEESDATPMLPPGGNNE